MKAQLTYFRFLHLLVLAGFFAMRPNGLAWSSKSTPICEDVHQKAIAKVLKDYPEMPLNALKILQQQQEAVDKDQKAYQSFEHAMTGLEKDQAVESQRTRFVAATEKFLQEHFKKALDAKKIGESELAFKELGTAIHPLQDATSPAHKVFQPWRDGQSWWSMALHLWKENYYPGDSAESVSLRKDLEDVVRWALDIYLEKKPLPAHFMNEKGELEFPSPYGASTLAASK